MRKKTYFIIIIAIIAVVCISALATHYFLFTPAGLKKLSEIVLSRYAKSEDVNIGDIKGTLADGISLSDVSITNLKYLPIGSLLKAKNIDIEIDLFNLAGLIVKVKGGELKLPNANQLFFHGDYIESAFDLNIYSKIVDAGSLKDLFQEIKFLNNISGLLADMDIYVKGNLGEPELIGEFRIENLYYKAFLLEDCPITFSLKCRDISDVPKIYGDVILKGGLASGKKTAIVEIHDSRIIFNGDPKKPTFDLKGTSEVSRTKIEIALKGNVDVPDLRLSSEPPASKEWLLLMLATNKIWDGAKEALTDTKSGIPIDLARDFVDYFLFSGAGSKILGRIGAPDVSLKYNENRKGVEIKKDLSGKANLNYSVDAPQSKEDKSGITQKIGAGYNITENVSLEGERDLKKEKVSESEAKTEANDKVMIKYKKNF